MHQEPSFLPQPCWHLASSKGESGGCVLFPQDHRFVKEKFGLTETPGDFTNLGFILMPLKKADELHPSVPMHISLNGLVANLGHVAPTKE